MSRPGAEQYAANGVVDVVSLRGGLGPRLARKCDGPAQRPGSEMRVGTAQVDDASTSRTMGMIVLDDGPEFTGLKTAS